MNENRWIGLMSGLGLALMFGLLWEGGASGIVFALLGLGAGLMVGVCVLAEFWITWEIES